MEQDKNKKTNPFGGMRQARRAVSDFLRAGRRKEAKQASAASEDNPIDIADRIRRMSNEDFDAAVSGGKLTPEQIRKAGEYEFDNYMGDVWSESHYADEGPEPTYDEFIANPQKYGVTYTDEDAAGDPNMDIYPVNWGRYKSTIRQK